MALFKGFKAFVKKHKKKILIIGSICIIVIIIIGVVYIIYLKPDAAAETVKKAGEYIGHITEYDKDGIPNYTFIFDEADIPAWARRFYRG